MITWDDTMSTGFPNLDAQHKEIIEKYNELAEAMADGSGEGRAAAGDILDFLQFYAVWHFEREEECMAQYQCPAAEANKQAHAEFLATFGQFYEQWHASMMDVGLMQETFAELGRWIENHILHTDSQLAWCINATHTP